MSHAPDIIVREIDPVKHQERLFELSRLLAPDLTRTSFDQTLKALPQQQYRIGGAFCGDTLVGCIGVWCIHQFWCGKLAELDNVMVSPEYRRMGIANKLVIWAEAAAREEGADMCMLKAYKTNLTAAALYAKLGYRTPGDVFLKPMNQSWDELDAILADRQQHITPTSKTA